MSVIDSPSEADSTITAILSELKIIDEHQQQRDKIYQDCLSKYMNHLNLETQQLLNLQSGVQKRSNSIRQSFEVTYDTLFDGADRALRSMRRTFQAKRNFWNQTISEFANVNDLEIKKELHALKRDAEQRSEEAIDARRLMKKIPFIRVFTKKEADKTLANFQQSNNNFEGKVYLGTNATTRWRPLQDTYLNSANKQNESNAKNTYRSISKRPQQNQILNQFVKR